MLKARILHLPLAFDDKWTQGAINKYMKSVRSEAPYLPSNIDFIAANNGLEGGRTAVRDTVFSASYMVLGLGDVYLGAPCAVPLDPRCGPFARASLPRRVFVLGSEDILLWPVNIARFNFTFSPRGMALDFLSFLPGEPKTLRPSVIWCVACLRGLDVGGSSSLHTFAWA